MWIQHADAFDLHALVDQVDGMNTATGLNQDRDARVCHDVAIPYWTSDFCKKMEFFILNKKSQEQTTIIY